MVEKAHGNNKNKFPRKQTRATEYADNISNIAGRVEYDQQLGQQDEVLDQLEAGLFPNSEFDRMEEGRSHSVSSGSSSIRDIKANDELSSGASDDSFTGSGRSSVESHLSDTDSSKRSIENLDV